VTPVVPFSLLLDEAVRWTRGSARRLFLPFAVPVAALTTLMTVVQLLAQGPMPTPNADPIKVMTRSCSSIFIVLLLWVVLVLVYDVLMVATADVVAGSEVDLVRAVRFLFRPRVLGTMLLSWVCIGASMACCGIPVLILWPLLTFVLPAMAFEGVTGTDALRRSFQLATYNPGGRWGTLPWLKVIAINAVAIAASFLLAAVVAVPAEIAQVFSIVRHIAAGEDLRGSMMSGLWLAVPSTFVRALLGTLAQVFACFATLLLFRDLRARREGSDLATSIGWMTGGGERLSPPSSDPG
jgi:hypothetical protein